MRFARLVDGFLEPAPPYYIIGGKRVYTNDEKIHNAFGYYLVVYTEQPIKEGYYYTPRFEFENNRIYQYWDEHPIPV